jgi:hypothetical protein
MVNSLFLQWGVTTDASSCYTGLGGENTVLRKRNWKQKGRLSRLEHHKTLTVKRL